MSPNPKVWCKEKDENKVLQMYHFVSYRISEGHISRLSHCEGLGFTQNTYSTLSIALKVPSSTVSQG